MENIFPDQLYILRTSRPGLTQDKLAIDLNFKGKQRISDLENGKYEPSVEDLIIISDYFGVTIDFLITGKEKQDLGGLGQDELKEKVADLEKKNRELNDRINEQSQLIKFLNGGEKAVKKKRA
jgi:transcriptional regulator with XRE-family HTH domain